jgi:MFS family permease
MKILYDTKERPITKKRVNRSMLYSLIGGGFGSVWFLFTSPQQLLTILVKNNLGASSSELGLFLGAMNIISIFHLASFFIYSRLKTIKPFYLTMGFIHRSQTFLIAAASFYAAAGGDRRIALYMIMISSLTTFIFGNTAGSGWWAWMNRIVPPSRRSSYFGKRSSLAQTLNIITFLAATISLDLFKQEVFLVFGIIYLFAAVLGVTETILHLRIPEPKQLKDDRVPAKLSTFIQPIQNKNFRTLCIVAGIAMMGINTSSPFFIPMITDPNQIGAPTLWIGLIYAISQFTWVLLIPLWGTLMDRFGRKPVTMIGMIFPLSYLGYLFITPENYHVLLPIIALTGGIFSPALYEGLNQVMLSLVPKKNQTAYIAWYWAMLGIIQGLGPVFGGFLLERTGSIDLLVFSSILIVALAFLLFNSVATGKELKFRRLVSTISSPGIIKAYFNIPILGKSTDTAKVGKALQGMSRSQGSLALDEILIRLDDADDEVREEAVKALGRIGNAASEDILIQYLSDSTSLVRVECARALGKMRSLHAVPNLIDALHSEDERLVQAAARALGRIDTHESAQALLGLFTEPRSIIVKAASAEGLSARKERIAVLHEVLSLCDQTSNPVIRKQLYISIGNIIGKPGEFYQYLTGTEQAREEAIQRLFSSTKRHLRSLQKTTRGMIDHVVFDTLPQAVNYFETEEYEQCFRALYTIFMNLIYRKIIIEGETELIDEHSIETLASKAPRLYAAYTLITWYEKLYEDDLSAILPTELLLLFYAIRYYSIAENKRQQPVKKQGHKISPGRST